MVVSVTRLRYTSISRLNVLTWCDAMAMSDRQECESFPCLQATLPFISLNTPFFFLISGRGACQTQTSLFAQMFVGVSTFVTAN